MSIRTKPIIILFKNNVYEKAIEINTEKFRLDDGIGYKIWDINNNSEKDKLKHIEKYKLSNSEYETLQFEYFWFEDLSVEIDEENSFLDYSKIKPTNLSSPETLKLLLEKIYIIEKRHWLGFFTDFSKAISENESKEKMEGFALECTRHFSGTYDTFSFINLIGILMGALNNISAEYELKVIICAA